MSAERRTTLFGRRWWVLGGLMTSVAVAGACANVSEPPGGPPDVRAPVVVKITPDSGAIVVRPKEVTVQFDEVISETPRGAQNLSSLVFISPRSGIPEVNWGRSRISIKPSKGWKRNTVYSIVISPGITDLRNNGIDSTIRIVFSTGGEIPNTKITGAVFEWTAARGAPRALVEALAIDTVKHDTTAYQTLADSAGRYELRHLPTGPYLLRSVLDRNNNRELDPLEPWDTVRVTVAQSANADFYAFVHDSVGVRISAFSELDSGHTLKLTFDKPYAPGQFWTIERAIITRPDSSLLRILKVQTPAGRAQDDSLRARARADSVVRATADTSRQARARADSLAQRKRADSVANAELAQRELRRLAALRGGRPVVRDTTPPPKFQRPLVYNELFITLAEPLPPAMRLKVVVTAVGTLSGVFRTTTREYTTAPAVKRDTTPARKP